MNRETELTQQPLRISGIVGHLLHQENRIKSDSVDTKVEFITKEIFSTNDLVFYEKCRQWHIAVSILVNLTQITLLLLFTKENLRGDEIITGSYEVVLTNILLTPIITMMIVDDFGDLEIEFIMFDLIKVKQFREHRPDMYRQKTWYKKAVIFLIFLTRFLYCASTASMIVKTDSVKGLVFDTLNLFFIIEIDNIVSKFMMFEVDVLVVLESEQLKQIEFDKLFKKNAFKARRFIFLGNLIVITIFAIVMHRYQHLI
jgi:hypothetical protein